MKIKYFKLTQDNILMIVFACVLFFVAVGLFVNTGKSCDTNVEFIVVGDFEELNGTIPQLQFECIEMCSDQFDNDGYNYLELCYEQCTTAGTLGCDNCRGFVEGE